MSKEEFFQLEDEDRNGTCPFIMVHGPEIVDGRLTDGEKILLFWLRLRSRATKGQNTWVSWKTVSQDLGIDESTVKRRAKKLRELGWIKCQSRDYAASKMKFLRRASSMYDDELWSWGFWDWCTQERSPEQIDELRSIRVKNAPNGDAEDLDNADDHPLSAKMPLHEGQKRPYIRGKNDTSEEEKRIKNKSEKDRKLANQHEADSQTPRRIGFKGGTAYDLDTEEVIEYESDSSAIEDPRGFAPCSEKNKGETAGPERASLSEADGDARRAVADRIIPSVGLSADRKAKKALARSEERRDAQEASGEAEKIRAFKLASKEEKMTVKNQLERFMMDAYRDSFPDARMGRFGVQEYSKLTHIMEIYDNDADFVRKAWKFLCEDWEEISAKLKIKDSVPTIGVFVYFRESIFAMVQEVKTTRQELESGKTSGTFEW